ncbi:MAG: plasmid pRiA4b ORF-3 family protein [Rhizomicrobium sp.]
MAAIVRLKITLDDVKPQVLRRIDVPVAIRPDRLHLALQAALGWTNSHLWEIRVSDTGWGPKFEDDWGDGPLDAARARLIDVLEDTGARTLHYLYDFGDSWEHTIKIERIGDALPEIDYPVLVEARGRCPPEDVGGFPGYEEFLDALADRKHPRRAEFVEWHGAAFDPNDLDIDAISAELEALAGTWSRKPRVKRPRKS